MNFVFQRVNIKDGVSYFKCNNYYEISKENSDVYRVYPTMVRLKYNYSGFRNFRDIINIKPSIKLDFSVELLRKNRNGDVVFQNLRSPYNKKFEVNHSIVEAIKNIDGAISSEILKNDFDILCDNFIVNFDSNKKYISVVEINANIIRELESGKFESIDNIIKNMVTKKELRNFYEELYNSINSEQESNEKVFELILKKYQKMLPLIIPSIDLLKDFQYSIEEEGLEENIIDAIASGIDMIPNLIELKKSTTQLLCKNKKYRNNTYKPSAEFAGAIQQANMQRIHYIIGATRPEQVIVKSILLIGNKSKEFDSHENKTLLYNNLDTIRYNNKDTEIITYDELLDRILNIINKFC